MSHIFNEHSLCSIITEILRTLNKCVIFFFFAELQKIRQKVVSEIKSTKQLEDDLDQMDIKIGLLIKNRVTLQVQNFFYLKLCILNNFRICISTFTLANIIVQCWIKNKHKY